MKPINEDVFAASYAAAAKGLWPRRVEIAAGAVLHRFIDLHRAPVLQAADGPWWFEYEQFRSIKHFAARHGYSAGYAARLFAAILYEWSEVNAVVRASVKAPLIASERQPQVASRMTPMQGPLEVYQLYVPGLGMPHRRFDSMMQLLGHEPIATG